MFSVTSIIISTLILLGPRLTLAFEPRCEIFGSKANKHIGPEKVVIDQTNKTLEITSSKFDKIVYKYEIGSDTEGSKFCGEIKINDCMFLMISRYTNGGEWDWRELVHRDSGRISIIGRESLVSPDKKTILHIDHPQGPTGSGYLIRIQELSTKSCKYKQVFSVPVNDGKGNELPIFFSKRKFVNKKINLEKI